MHDHFPPTDREPERRAEPLAERPLERRTLLLGLAATAVGVAGAGAFGSLPAAAAPTSQNGWPVITSSSSSALDRGFVGGGVTFPGGVRRGDVSTILRYVANRFDREVENLRSGWCWGWNYRRIRNGSSYSNHASGTAIDVNAPEHPLGVAGTFSAAQVRKIRAILAACDGVVRWGGNYSGRKDEMHFEINKPPGDPAVRRLAAKLGGSTPPPPPPPPASGWPTLKSGSRGFAVKTAQFLLVHAGYRIAADGIFGAGTRGAVVAFQRRRGLAADGIVGPRTWGSLIVTVRQGSRGNAVHAAQTALNAHGARLAVDGIAGPATRSAIVAFQRRRGLAADGIVGPKTWAALV